MKGIIFREFLNMVEDEFGDELVDAIIIDSKLPTEGAYTSVGTYDHSELVRLITSLSKHTKIQIPALMTEFGKFAFTKFASAYIRMFEGIEDGFTFLSVVEDTIHVEVLKLYPEAELPTVDVVVNNNVLTLTYRSSRKMVDFAEGLIWGCLKHFNEEVKMDRRLLREDGSVAEFIITRN